MRHYDKSKSRLKDTKDWEPDRKAVAKRSKASMSARASNADLAGKAKKVGQRVRNVLSLALAGWQIYDEASPTKVTLETGAGLLLAAGATALVSTTAPAWVPFAVGVAAATGGAYAAGWAYEKCVPLRTRGRIDEGIKDAASWVGDKAYKGWKSVFA